ncbi:uncharacterized protein LOC136094568 [Hydra vulgaris]|uniref:uncharacterized protein LOC136094568 n=1 Tax=Hydra vulgaris TaxID=6087 RepID=UPI0032EA405D
MDISEFIKSYLIPLFGKLSMEKNKTTFLIGDFNVDLLLANSDNSVSEFLDTIALNNFLPFISLPTRITNHSKTLIDNIFSNATSTNIFAGNFTSTVSDHLPQFLIHPLYRTKINSRKSCIFRRNLKQINCVELCSDFSKISWINVINVNEAKNPNNKLNLEKSYKAYRNLLVTFTRRSKKNHYSKFFSDNAKNLKSTWNGIKSLLNISSRVNSSPSCLSSINSMIHDPIKISESFNSFFVSVPEDLQNKIHSSNNDFNKYLKNPNLNSMFIKPTDKNEVLSIIHSLNDSKASGPYSIPIPIFKALANDISPVLSELFNLSFTSSVFPDILKTASVIPIHKNDSKLERNNYRPISLLSNVSKLLEKLMYSRIYNFLNNSAFFHIRQFGFRSNHSTSHALICITEMIRGAIDSGSFACGVFIDHQKAFDTVDHNILVKKLNYYGIRGIANHWFSSYITDRTQFVSINGFESTHKVIQYGVPQGSMELTEILLNELMWVFNKTCLRERLTLEKFRYYVLRFDEQSWNDNDTTIIQRIQHDLKCFGIPHFVVLIILQYMSQHFHVYLNEELVNMDIQRKYSQENTFKNIITKKHNVIDAEEKELIVNLMTFGMLELMKDKEFLKNVKKYEKYRKLQII